MVDKVCIVIALCPSPSIISGCPIWQVSVSTKAMVHSTMSRNPPALYAERARERRQADDQLTVTLTRGFSQSIDTVNLYSMPVGRQRNFDGPMSCGQSFLIVPIISCLLSLVCICSFFVLSFKVNPRNWATACRNWRRCSHFCIFPGARMPLRRSASAE